MDQAQIDQQKLFKDVTMQNVLQFAQIAAKFMEAMLGTSSAVEKVEYIENGPSTNQKLFISILFTGTVYGEYILALDEEVGANILGLSTSADLLPQTRKEMASAFCELANLTVGESILGLGDVYKKLTITTPRVYFGNVTYPNLKTGKATLRSDKGIIECYMYIDRMKLDIAASYKDALASLLKVHKELQSTMTKLQEQQGLLVQTEKMAALGTMAAGLAHEINTPLTTATIIGERLKEIIQSENAFDRPKFLQMLDKVETTIVRISRITDSLRSFANGMQNDVFKYASVHTLIDGALSFCEQQFNDKKINLQYDRTSDDIQIECRPPQLTQVLLSLLSNACDAVENRPTKLIEIKTRDLGHLFEIRITDSGVGIMQQHRDKIFDPFFTTKEVGKGSGLGLSVSKGIITDHQGTIQLDASSSGTCLVIQIPKKQPARALAS